MAGYWRSDPDTGVMDWIEQSIEVPKTKKWAWEEPNWKEPPVATIPEVKPLPKIKGLPEFDVKALSDLYKIPSPLFVTNPQQLADLKLPPEEYGARWKIAWEQYLTWEQAKYIGLDVPEGSVVKMTPMAGGEPEFTLLEQQKPPQIESDLEEVLRDVYPEMFKPSESYGFTPEQLPQMALQNIQGRMQSDFQGFVKDLYSRIGEFAGDVVLRRLGVTGEISLQALEQDEQNEKVLSIAKTLFPEYDSLDQFADFVNDNWETFIETIQTGGDSYEKRQLLEVMGVKPDVINDILGNQRIVMDVEGIRKLVIKTSDNNVYDREGNWLGFYDAGTKGIFNPYPKKPKGFIGKAGRSFIAGIGDVFQTSGGTARWLGFEDAGTTLSAMGSELQRYGVPSTTGEFDWWDVLNPDFWATKVTRTLPFALAIAPVAIGGFYGSGALAATLGVGRIATMVISSLSSAAMSRSIESALEAGGQYDDALARGKTEKEAKEEANQVFINNMKLAGMDAWEIGIALAPTPKWIPAQLVKSGLVRTARIGGKMIIVGLSEGGEEVYQDMITRHARGEEWKLDPISKEVFAIGAAMGVGMGLGGDVIQSIVNQSVPKLPPSLKAQFDEMVSKARAEGLNQQQAQTKALDTIVQSPEGKNIIQKAINRINEAIKQGKEVPEAGFTIPFGKGEEVTPEIAKVQGPDIAKQLDVTYEGIQEGTKTVPSMMMFTDKQTGSTFTARSLEEAKTKLTNMRQTFAEGERVTPAPEVYEALPVEEAIKLRKTENNLSVLSDSELRRQLGEGTEGWNQEVYDKIKAGETITVYRVVPKGIDRINVGDRVTQTEESAKLVSGEIYLPKEAHILKVEAKPSDLIVQMPNEFLYIPEPVIPTATAVTKVSGGFVAPSPKGSVGQAVNVAIKQAKKTGKDVYVFPTAEGMKLGDKAPPFGIQHIIVKPDGTHQVVSAATSFEAGRQAGIEPLPPAKVIIPKAEPGQPEAGLPYLSVPEETTLPMPDEVKTSDDRVVMPPPPPKEPPPPEPPPTHPPQPPPIKAGRITMPDLQPPQTVVDMYSKPDFWRRVVNLPLVRKVGRFNPAAVANNPAQQAIVLRAALKDEGAQKAQAVMSHLWEIGTQERIWGKTDEYGYLKAEQFAGSTIDDIRTNPTKFLPYMNEKQREWIKRASEIEKVKLEALKRNGVEINELSFEDGGEYAGRRVMGKFNDAGELIESGRIGIGGRLGAKQAFEKTRVFKTAEEGILANYRYMNTDEALYYNTVGAYNKIADRQMADWILSKVDWRTTKAPEALVLQAEAARLRLRKAQQLLASLNRAVRGERLPSNTINSIASVYADQADTLKNLIPELQKPSPETADTVQILTTEAKALISEAKVEYYQAVNERARAREEAMRVKYEEASIAHPAFAGKIFTGAEAKEIADILNRGLTPQFIEALGAVNKVNAIGRFFMLAGDVSPMTIQLQFLAFYRPVAYAKAMGGFVRAFFDPEFQYRYYANNRELINRHPTLILSGRGTEFTEFMGRGGLGKKLGVLAKPLVPFQKAFEGSIDVAGIELAKSLDHLATNPQRTLDVDQFINEFRGMTSSARIGVSSTQRQVETAILLAPRYNRAIAAYLFDIVRGGLRGSLARMSLAQGLAGISAMAVAVSIALNEDEDEIWQHFDPRSPKFFTWDVMGVKIGLGGKVRSIMKMFGNMLRTGEVGRPALNFLRGNLSPGASTGLDLLTGKNYIGEPTRDNVFNFSKTILQNFMMIWTQNFLLEGGTLKDKAIIATAEFLGLRGYDIMARKEWKIESLEEILGEVIGKTPVLTKKKPDIYDTRNIFSDIKRILKNILPEDILANKGFAGWGHLVTKIEQSEANSLPNIAFKDYNFDKAKGDTLSDYMSQWAERQRIEDTGERATYTRVKVVEGKEERTTFKGLEALNAHKVDYPNAQRGNLSKRERELLLEYNIAVNKKQFIEQHPEMKVNPRTAWLKSNPRENAELALVGQADILSKEAYIEFQKILKEMDIPNTAVLPMTLPPETSLDTHFNYIEMVSAGTHGSWEAQLLLKQDALKAKEGKIQSYVDWRTKEGEQLALSDTPIASLELKVKNHGNLDLIDSQSKTGYGNPDSPNYIVNEKEREAAILKLRQTKVDGETTLADVERKIKALEKGTDEAPVDEKLVNSHVEYMRLQDAITAKEEEEGAGAAYAKAKLYRVDNPDYDKWRQDETIWDKPLKPIDVTRIPIWRIDVKYAKEDEEYQVILDKYEGSEEREKTKTYLAEHDDYRLDSLRRDAYKLAGSETGGDFMRQQVENYVAYNEISEKGKRRERFIVENPDFALAMFQVTGKDTYKTRLEDVPNVAYDDLYDEFQEEFDKLDAFKDAKDLINYKDNTVKDENGLTERDRARQALRFDRNGRFTEFGLAEIRREGYGKFVPDEEVDNYVGYYQILGEKPGRDYRTDLWYEEDWFLMENKDFYQNVYLKILGNERKDFGKVPPRDVFKQYLRYLDTQEGKPRDDFRWTHRDLDAWLVTKFGYTPITEKKRREEMTPSERARESIWKWDIDTERKLKEIEELLGKLK